MAAGPRSNSDQPVHPGPHRLARMPQIDHVMEHQPAIVMHPGDKFRHRAERGDDNRHPMTDHHFEFVLEIGIAAMHDQIDGIGRRRVACLGLDRGKPRANLGQPAIKPLTGALVLRRKTADDASAATGEHQFRPGGQKHRRSDQWQPKAPDQHVWESHLSEHFFTYRHSSIFGILTREGNAHFQIAIALWTAFGKPSQDDAMPHDHHDHNPHSLLPSEPALRVKALETILVEKGLIDPAALDAIIDLYERDIGPQIGAGLVARAWVDPEFRAALLTDADRVIAELGHGGRQGEHVVVVENTPDTHNLVVCTLCSCYPWPLLGIPPGWYKSDSYRARAVREPRAVLAEFGITLAEGTAVRVWDSTAEIRYLVLPMRPDGTKDLDEATLAGLVTRDSMIGTGLPLPAGADT